jgi:hypothetical protein
MLLVRMAAAGGWHPDIHRCVRIRGPLAPPPRPRAVVVRWVVPDGVGYMPPCAECLQTR